MIWFNEPATWKQNSKDALEFQVLPKTDFWRKTFYSFTVDDGHFLYSTYGGEFEVKVFVEAELTSRFDHAGLMLRIDSENYVKFGLEYVDGIYNVSTVVTHIYSDWSLIPLTKSDSQIWLKAVRRLDSIDLFYSKDDSEYILIRKLWMQDNCPILVGMMAASPDGDGFMAKFSNYQVTHLPDQRRLEWLNNNK